jgi:hypothetical protein
MFFQRLALLIEHSQAPPDHHGQLRPVPRLPRVPWRERLAAVDRGVGECAREQRAPDERCAAEATVLSACPVCVCANHLAVESRLKQAELDSLACMGTVS